jgi:hypothetical protein
VLLPTDPRTLRTQDEGKLRRDERESASALLSSAEKDVGGWMRAGPSPV